MGKRIEYLDAMRGFAMFLVVTGHIITFSFGIVSDTFISSFFCGTLQLPLFFMISGYFSVKPGETLQLGRISRGIANKFPILIVSTLIFMSIFCVFHGSDIAKVLSGPSKSGYWYTISLFEFLLLYKAIEYACCLLKCSKRTLSIAVAIVTVAVIALFPLIDGALYTQCKGVYNALGLIHLKFYCYYLLGVLIHLNIDRFTRLIDNGLLPGISIAGMIGLLVIENTEVAIFRQFPIDYLAGICLTVFSLILTFALFQKVPSLSTSRYCGRFLLTMGTDTLSIYFLHYYFVFMALDGIGQYFVAHPSPLIEFVLASSIAILVIGACLILTRVFRLWAVTAYLLGIKRVR